MDQWHIFLANASADQDAADALLKHLAPVLAQHRISCHRETDTRPGDSVELFWQQLAEEAELIIILLSADLLVSDRLLRACVRANERPAVRIVPVLWRPCAWEASPFAKIKPLPSNGAFICYRARQMKRQ